MGTIQSVIFDMDGVLVDTMNGFYEAYRKTLEPYLIDYTLHEFQEMFGMRSDVTFRKVEKDHNIHFPSIEALIKSKEQFYHESLPDTLKPIPQTIETAKRLKEKGYQLAVATSSIREVANFSLEQAGIKDIFDCIITGDDVKHSKPNPEIFILTISEMGSTPNDSIIIEDSLPGLEAADAIGVRCISLIASYQDEKKFRKAYQVKPIEKVSSNEIISWIEAI
jgi:HAD superfamily hydrolase (TIGR01509 family)